MNGATEATLQELLAIAQAMNGNLIKLNSMFASFQKSGGMAGSGGGGAAAGAMDSAASAASGLSKSLGLVGTAFSVLEGAVSAVGKVLGVMASIVGAVVDAVAKTVGALVKFSLQAALGEAKLSDFYKAFSDVPIIGKFFSFMGDVVAMQERVLSGYQSVAKSGASFGGSLEDLRIAAAKSYMTLDSFVATVGKAGDLFVTMTGDMQSGISKFVNTQNKLMDPSGPYSQAIAGLGYTAEDTAASLQSIIKSQGIMTGKNAMSTDQLAASTQSYMIYLDELAKVTGKRRDQIQAEVDEAQADQAYQLFLDSITDPTQKEKILAHVAQQTALYGKTGADIAKNAVRGISAPMNDAQAEFMTFNRGIMRLNQQANQNINDRNVSNEQFKKTMGQANYDNLRETDKMLKGMGTVNTAIASSLYPSINGIVGATRKATAANFDYAKGVENAQKDQFKGSAGALQLAELRIKSFGTALLELISEVIRPIMPILTGWITGLHKAGIAVAKYLEDPASNFGKFMNDVLIPKMERVGDWFSSAFTKLMDAKPGEFWDTLGDILKDGFSNIWEDVEPVIVSVWKSIEPVVTRAFSAVFDSMMKVVKDWIGDNTWFGEASKDRKEREAGLQTQSFKDWMAKLQSSTDMFGQFGKFNRSAVESGGEKEAYQIYKQQVESKNWNPAEHPDQQASPKDKKAGGGFINPGSYLVGEKGPEVINVGTSGDVISNENLSKMFSSGGQQNNLAGPINQLNTLVAELIRINREQRDLNKQHLDATKSLNGNLFLA